MIDTAGLILPLAGWMAGLVLLARARDLSGASSIEDARDVTVIIPARDEERRLPRLLESLRRQTTPPREVIVVNDHSTDGTRALAEAAGARVIDAPDLPPDWLGKPWALHHGARQARGTSFLFLDADVFLPPDGLARLAAAGKFHGGALSVLPHHRTERSHESLSFFFNAVQAGASNHFGLFRAPAERRRLFGPLLLMSREDYIRAGGHEAVKSSVVENFDLARHLNRAGVRITGLLGRGGANIRMYGQGTGDLARGWAKSFARGSRGTPMVPLVLCVLWITGGLDAARQCLADLVLGNMSRLPMTSLMYGLHGLWIHRLARKLGDFRGWAAWIYPIPALFFTIVFLASTAAAIFGRRTTWKGRRVAP
jgi:4,4'-diaponeurosporenoate glycosyltransferase